LMPCIGVSIQKLSDSNEEVDKGIFDMAWFQSKNYPIQTLQAPH